jgi:hypothetical protein
MLNMRSHFRLLLLAFVALLALGITSVAAAPPTTASGTFTTTDASLTNPRTIGSNTIFDLTFTGVWTGTFAGTVVGHGTVLLHADGSGEGNTVDVFTGTVNGTSGTVTLNDVSRTDAAGSFRGTFSILSGTGDLANVHGALHAVGILLPCCPPTGPYTGTIEMGGH